MVWLGLVFFLFFEGFFLLFFSGAVFLPFFLLTHSGVLMSESPKISIAPAVKSESVHHIHAWSAVPALDVNEHKLWLFLCDFKEVAGRDYGQSLFFFLVLQGKPVPSLCLMFQLLLCSSRMPCLIMS